MNLNREQFLKAVERGQTLLKELKKDYPELQLKPVFSRFGPRSGQCDLTTNLRKIVMDFPEMLAGRDLAKSLRAESFSTAEMIEKIKKLLIWLKQGEPVEKEVNELERRLLEPELKLYCGDVLIEYRPGDLKYESLRRLQQDPRLPPGLNEVGNIRVIAGALSSFIK